ncbi:helix-turn-helix domain-containing protein [Sphingomonas cavernae]|uniref:helix-turn-helix domain-containing protein n=1 Tax=Sphingomonas cavernae TaxID=2320861 RepID=UPI001EE4EE9D|nr:XRE family transcriptional regulator [Sphingomonas cavernae]
MHSQDRPKVLEHVAGNVRALRQQRGMSQEALASASDVSRRMIVNIETGDANVSLATLDRLAEALGVRFSDLVQAPQRPDPARIEVVAWAGETPESQGTLLSSFPAAAEVEVWRWSLAPGETYHPVIHDAAWTETVYVLEGALTILWDEVERILPAGDFHAYNCQPTRRYRNDGKIVARFIRTLAH